MLASPWIWIAGTVAFLIFLPNLLWNVHHQFPFLELQANIRASGRDVPLGPLGFLAQETLAMHPLSLPVWLAGLWFFFSKAGQPFRTTGWAGLFVATVIMIVSPRIYYLFPAFPLLFAGGSVAWESWISQPRRMWVRFAYPSLMVATAGVIAP